MAKVENYLVPMGGRIHLIIDRIIILCSFMLIMKNILISLKFRCSWSGVIRTADNDQRTRPGIFEGIIYESTPGRR